MVLLNRPDGWLESGWNCKIHDSKLRGVCVWASGKTKDTVKAEGRNFCRSSLGCKTKLSFQPEIISAASAHQIFLHCKKGVTNTLKLLFSFRLSKFWSFHFHVLRGKNVRGCMCDSFKCVVSSIAEGLPKIWISVCFDNQLFLAMFWAKQNVGQRRRTRTTMFCRFQHHVFLTAESATCNLETAWRRKSVSLGLFFSLCRVDVHQRWYFSCKWQRIIRAKNSRKIAGKSGAFQFLDLAILLAQTQAPHVWDTALRQTLSLFEHLICTIHASGNNQNPLRTNDNPNRKHTHLINLLDPVQVSRQALLTANRMILAWPCILSLPSMHSPRLCWNQDSTCVAAWGPGWTTRRRLKEWKA